MTETVHRKQLRPVIQPGATATDRLFTNNNNPIGGQSAWQGPENNKKPRASGEERGSDQHE